MMRLSFLVLALLIAIPFGRAAEAEQPAGQETLSAPARVEQCLKKVVRHNLRLSGELKARWTNILNFCYDGVEITDWQLSWRPRLYSSEWRFVRLVGPRITGNPVSSMFFQTEGIFRGAVESETHTWRSLLWQRAFPNGRWTFGGRQTYR